MNFKRIIKVNDPIFDLQWFKTNIPQKEEIIFGFVDNIGTSQVDITILNYNGIKGIIAFNQLSSKKIRSIRSLFKEGDIKPFIVTDVIVKGDDINVDLSFKNINDYGDEIATIEKYYLLILIMFRWFKDIYREQFFINSLSSKISDNDQLDNQQLDNKLLSQNVESIHDMKGLDRSISFSNIIDTNKLNVETNDLDLEQYCNIEENEQNDDTSNQTNQPDQPNQQNESPISNITRIPFSKTEWNELMELTLWSCPLTEIYDKFLSIKTQKISFKNAFPELFEKIGNSYVVRNKTLTFQDITRLELLIEKFISYEITVNVTLNLTCWSIRSLDKIKQIVGQINTIPDTYYDSQISFNSVMINAPNYEWIIKSSNKFVIDQLYQNKKEDEVDGEINNEKNVSTYEENDLVEPTKYISLNDAFDSILKQFTDIKYEIVIQREDKS